MADQDHQERLESVEKRLKRIEESAPIHTEDYVQAAHEAIHAARRVHAGMMAWEEQE